MSGLLIVDDQDVVRQGIRKMLEEFELGISPVLEACDGVEALILARKHKPEIVLVDIMMPDMDGLAFVDELKRTGSEAKIVIISAYSEFDYTKKAIALKVDNYILKPVTRKELYQSLTSLLNSIRLENNNRLSTGEQQRKYDYLLLNEYLKNRDVSINLESLFKNLGFGSFTQRFFQIVLVKASGTPEIGIEVFKETLDSRLINGQVEMASFLSADNTLVCILNTDADGECFPAFADSLQGFLIGASQVADGLEKLPELYRQAEAAIKECRFRGLSSFSFSQINEINSLPIGVNEYNRIVQDIRNGRKDSLIKTIEEVFFKLGTSGGSFQNIRDSLNNLMLFVHMNLAEDFQELKASDEYKAMLFAAMDYLSLKAAVKGELDRLYEKYSQTKGMGVASPAIREALLTISKNYSKNLSLAFIANQLDMNYSYLSTLFTKTIGMSFTDYLLKCRLEKAMELLQDGLHRVQEVSDLVGFNDPKYFCKAFKKQFGETPSEMMMRGAALRK